MRLAIIIPVSNEEETISSFCNSLNEQLIDLQIEIKVYFVLDQSSKDSTLRILENFCKQNSFFSIHWSPQNRNVVDAYVSGYRHALNFNHDFFLEMDAGFSHDPSQVIKFIRCFSKGYDCVYGSRFIDGGKIINSNSKRLFFSKYGKYISNFLLGMKYSDSTSGFQGFSKITLENWINYPLRSKGHFYQTEVKYLLKNHKWIEVPITYKNPSKSVTFKVIRNSIECLLYYWVNPFPKKLIV